MGHIEDTGSGVVGIETRSESFYLALNPEHLTAYEDGHIEITYEAFREFMAVLDRSPKIRAKLLGPPTPEPTESGERRESMGLDIQGKLSGQIDEPPRLPSDTAESGRKLKTWMAKRLRTLASLYGCGCPSCEEGHPCAAGIEADQDTEALLKIATAVEFDLLSPPPQSQDREAMADKVNEILNAALRCERGSVYRYDEGDGRFYVRWGRVGKDIRDAILSGENGGEG